MIESNNCLNKPKDCEFDVDEPASMLSAAEWSSLDVSLDDWTSNESITNE